MGCARPGGLTLTLAALSIGMKRGRSAPPGDGSDGRWESAAASRLGSVLSSLVPCSTRSCISSGEQPGVLATKAKLARAGQGPSRNRLFGMGTPPPTPLPKPPLFASLPKPFAKRTTDRLPFFLQGFRLAARATAPSHGPLLGDELPHQPPVSSPPFQCASRSSACGRACEPGCFVG